MLCSAGVGGPSLGKPQPSSFQTPIFSPTPIPWFFCCFFSPLLAFGCFVLEGFFVWLVFWISFPPSFVFSSVSPGFVLDVDAVFCP